MRSTFLIMAMISALMLGACASDRPAGPIEVVDPSQAALANEPYRLGTGDRVRVDVYDEPRHSGEFEIDGLGSMSLPLIGTVDAAGLTLREFELAVVERLSEGFLVDPSVSARVTNYRPFFILGQVGSPGKYPYSEGLSLQNAIALAGGFGKFANSRVVYVQREGRDATLEVRDIQNFRILPGDNIQVPVSSF